MSTGLALATREVNPPAPPPPPPGNGIIQGTRSLVGGGTVGAGTVQLYRSGGVFVANAVPNGAGFYQFAGLGDDSYNVVDQPPPGFLVAGSQAGALSFTPSDNPSAVIVGGAGVTVNLLVEQMLFTDLFQQYTSDANLNAAGLVVAGLTDQNGGWNVPGGNAIVLDPAGGPAGGKAMRYDWPARAGSGCNNDITLRAMMRFNPTRSGASWYFRWREKMTNPWGNGSQASCPAGHWEYKFLRFVAGGGQGVYEVLMPHGHGAGNPNPNLLLGLVMGDSTGLPNHNTSNALQGSELNLGLPTVWPGAYRIFVLEILGHGTTDPKMKLYIDGALALTLQRPGGAPLYSFTNNNFVFVELGANLDSGPDAVQSRWFAEWTIGQTRPSFL